MHSDPLLYSPSSIDVQFAEFAVRQLSEAGFVAYFAGGCVRDALLGNEPKDFDVATDATTDQVREVFGPSRTRAVGEAFGVVVVHGRMRGKACQVEVATFRCDGSYSDGRRPDWVVYSTPEQDAQRRDFTINGLFYDPLQRRVIDYVGGREDLKNGIVRAIGNPALRIGEDKLRMLRAIRFAGRFDFSLDRETQRAIEEAAPSISIVSGERIGMELRKMLEHPSRLWAWDRLIETGLTRFLLPELDARWQDPEGRRRDLSVLALLDADASSFPTALSAIVFPWAREAEDTGTVHRLLVALKHRWKLANSEVESMTFGLKHATDLLNATQLPWSTVQPLLTSPFIRDSLNLAEGVARSTGNSESGIDCCRGALAKPMEEWNPPPLIQGGDLISLGWKPGPRFSEVLLAVRAQQLDGALASREDALEWIRRHSS